MSQIVLNQSDCKKKKNKCTIYCKALFLMGYKKLTFYRQARYHAGFIQKWRNTAPITPPPKNQCLQMLFWRRIIIATTTKTLKHWQVLT